MSLAIALGHHRANRSLRTSTNLNFIQPKLFGAARQDDHRISDCTVFVIQILGVADVAFRVFGAELRTVLSATTMLADKLHRLSGRAIAQRFSGVPGMFSSLEVKVLYRT